MSLKYEIGTKIKIKSNPTKDDLIKSGFASIASFPDWVFIRHYNDENNAYGVNTGYNITDSIINHEETEKLIKKDNEFIPEFKKDDYAIVGSSKYKIIKQTPYGFIIINNLKKQFYEIHNFDLDKIREYNNPENRKKRILKECKQKITLYM